MGTQMACGAEAGVAGVAILEAEDAGGTLHGAGDVVVGEGYEVAVFVNDFDGDVGHFIRSREGGFVDGGAQGVGTSAGGDGGGGAVVGRATERSSLVVHVPIEDAGGFVACSFSADGLAVEQELGRGAVGVADDTYGLPFVVVPEGGGVGRYELTLLSAAPTSIAASEAVGCGADVAYGRFAPKRSAVVSVGLDVACEVEESGLRAACGPGSALAQVVDACPEELSEDVFIVAHGLPCGEVVTVLAAVDDAPGIALVVFLIAALGLVVAHDIYGLGIGGLVAHDDSGEGSGDGA